MNAFCLSFLLSLLRYRPIGYSDEVVRLHTEDTPELGNVVCSDDSHLHTFCAFWLESASLILEGRDDVEPAGLESSEFEIIRLCSISWKG
ncbi:hypothetical protein EDB85DRAFT_1977053 [Lactarius pseudohatsudake]|nr:hypothetical protein EDB85DRAFT_1977053 [Lactarius pseudohatsudake]